MTSYSSWNCLWNPKSIWLGSIFIFLALSLDKFSENISEGKPVDSLEDSFFPDLVLLRRPLTNVDPPPELLLWAFPISASTDVDSAPKQFPMFLKNDASALSQCRLRAHSPPTGLKSLQRVLRERRRQIPASLRSVSRMAREASQAGPGTEGRQKKKGGGGRGGGPARGAGFFQPSTNPPSVRVSSAKTARQNNSPLTEARQTHALPTAWSFSRGRAAENLGLGAVSGNGFRGLR